MLWVYLATLILAIPVCIGMVEVLCWIEDRRMVRVEQQMEANFIADQQAEALYQARIARNGVVEEDRFHYGEWELWEAQVNSFKRPVMDHDVPNDNAFT